jgi:hypothetical protein
MIEVTDAIKQIVDRLELFADKLDDKVYPFDSMSDREDYLHSLATIKNLLKDL